MSKHFTKLQILCCKYYDSEMIISFFTQFSPLHFNLCDAFPIWQSVRNHEIQLSLACTTKYEYFWNMQTYLNCIIPNVDFLGIIGVPIARSICDSIAQELTQYGVRRRGLPGDVNRGGGCVVGRCRNGLARGSCKRLSRNEWMRLG